MITSLTYEDGLILNTLNKYLPLIVIGVGTVGECLSLVVYRDKRFLATSFSFYNISATIIDLLIFYFGYLKFYLQARGTDPVAISMFSCKFLRFSVRPMFEIVSWIQLLTTFDHYLFIHYPNQFMWFRKRRTQVKMVAMVALCCFIIHSPVLLYFGHYERQDNSTRARFVCFPREDRFYASLVNDLGFFFMFCVIPFTIMFYLTISISVKFLRSKERIHNMVARNLQQVREESSCITKEYRFAFAIIFQNVLFLTFTLPQSSLWPIISLRAAGLLRFSKHTNAVLELLQAVFLFLMYAFFALKFVFNLVFNSLYRQVFVETFLSFGKSKNHGGNYAHANNEMDL